MLGCVACLGFGFGFCSGFHFGLGFGLRPSRAELSGARSLASPTGLEPQSGRADRNQVSACAVTRPNRLGESGFGLASELESDSRA